MRHPRLALRPRRMRHGLAAAALLLASTAGVLTTSAPPAGAAATSSAKSVTKTVSREFIAQDGTKSTVDSRKVTLKVDQTTDLHSLQLINVSWSGAHPTGGLVSDQNSDNAMNEEYSFALFQCRGTDTAAHPITPNTCWTQSADERFSYGADDPPYPGWRSDARATTAERQAIVDSPKASSLSTECRNNLYGTTVQRWVQFKGADGTDYPGGPFGCAGYPPEAAPASLGANLQLPSNETFGVSDNKGNGSARFDIFTEDHASLGCSQKVACTLVAVPIMGLSCDPYGTELPAAQRPSASDAITAKQTCEAGPKYQAGQQLPSQGSGEPAVSGLYWWSPSNWSNRLSVPLTFAPPDDACSLNSSGTPLQLYGSEVMSKATSQWAPHFCLNSKLFTYKHVQTPEELARTLLYQGQSDAALTSLAPSSPYPNPTVNAPIAVTGFGIGYAVDDVDGQQVTDLKLNARLLAKLLTESYPSQGFVKEKHPGETNNPLNITYDPEFKALNPTVPESTAVGAATLFSPNTNTDVIYAVTSYINADPDARAWLDGKADPWGMTVNPFYKGMAMPVENFPLQDTFEPKDYYQPGRNDCLAANPVPYLPLVAAPTARLFTIAQAMQFAVSPSQIICTLPSPIPGDTSGAKMTAAGRQASGHHMLMGIVAIGDAERAGVPMAELQSSVSSSAPAQFTNADGRSFAKADDDGMKAAAETLQADTTSGVWPVDYSTLREHADAYPGTMVVYAAVPTRSLPSTDAGQLATFLRFTASEGQKAGTSPGELAPGFLPMTSANGLGDLASYTTRAANAVQYQQGCLPSLTKDTPTCVPSKPQNNGGSTGGTSGGSTSGGSTGGTGGGSTSGSSGTTGGATGGTSGTTSGGSTSGGKTGKSSTAPSSSSASPSPVSARTPRTGSGVGGWVLPVLLILGVIALLAGLIVRVGVRK